MCRALTRVLVAVAFLLPVTLAYGVELPPELAADRLVVRAERQALEGEHRAALASLDQAQAPFPEHCLGSPPDFWSRHAQVAPGEADADRQPAPVGTEVKALDEPRLG